MTTRPAPSPMPTALLVALLCALPAAGPGTALASDDGLGRLFHTPLERSTLDSLRERKPGVPASASRPVAETVRIDGIVRRSSGRTTVWLNGTPRPSTAPISRVGDDRVELLTGSGRRVEVKVGDSVQLTPPRNSTP